MTIQNKKTPEKPPFDFAKPFSEHLQTEITAIQKRWKDISFSKVSRGGNPLFMRTRLIFSKRYKKHTFKTDIVFSESLEGKELQDFVFNFRNESLKIFYEMVKIKNIPL